MTIAPNPGLTIPLLLLPARLRKGKPSSSGVVQAKTRLKSRKRSWWDGAGRDKQAQVTHLRLRDDSHPPMPSRMQSYVSALAGHKCCGTLLALRKHHVGHRGAHAAGAGTCTDTAHGHTLSEGADSVAFALRFSRATQTVSAASVSLYAGDGWQLMRWLATAACARLAFMTRALSMCVQRLPQFVTQVWPFSQPHRAGDHPSRFVPQSVGITRDSACDPDTVRRGGSNRAGCILRVALSSLRDTTTPRRS